MRTSLIALAAAALMSAGAAPATVVDFSYAIISDGSPYAEIASGTGAFETIGDNGTFDLANLSAFTISGDASVIFVSGSYSFGIGDLSAFSATLSNGTLTNLSFAVSGAVDFFDLSDNLFGTGNVTITAAGLAPGNVTATVNSGYFPTFGTGDLTATARPAAAIPEPASWALMLAGFGLVGAALRGRRAEAVRAA
jgi:hypothetical protein